MIEIGAGLVWFLSSGQHIPEDLLCAKAGHIEPAQYGPPIRGALGLAGR